MNSINAIILATLLLTPLATMFMPMTSIGAANAHPALLGGPELHRAWVVPPGLSKTFP